MKLRELTQAEQDYATDHHHLVYDFLRCRRLDDRDYYDIVVFGYLKAVQRYLDNPLLQAAYPFKVIAFRLMWDAYLEHLRYLNSKMRKGQVISLDCPVSEDGELLGNLIPSISDDPTVSVALSLLDMIDTHLTEHQRVALRLRLEGYTCKEIAKITDRKVSTVNIDFVKMREQIPARCVI